MNIGKSIVNNLYESFNSLEFEKHIPHEMRFKEHHVESDENGECLYWITQDFFTEEDIKDFIEALKNTRFDRAYITVRDLSSYYLDKDLNRKVLVKVDTDGNIEDLGYFKEAEPYLTESEILKEEVELKKRIAKDIEWETDGNEKALESLPKEVEIPEDINGENIADYLSDEYGYLVNQFNVEYINEKSDKVYDKKEEALERMKMIKLSRNCINAFKSGKVWESEGIGALYEVNDEEQQMIDNFEKVNNGLVYHMIHNVFEFGECWSMFYVSDHPEEWKQDKEDLEDGYAMVYVFNKDNPEFSEFGSIAFKSNIGGLVRLS